MGNVLIYVDWKNRQSWRDDEQFWEDVLERFEYNNPEEELLFQYLRSEFSINLYHFKDIVPSASDDWIADILDSENWYEYKNDCLNDFISYHYSQYMFPDGEQVFINFDQQIIGVWEEVYDAFMFNYMQEYTLEDYNDEFVDGTEQEYMEYIGDIVSAYIWDHTKRI